jgi:hypothetical protein
MDGNAAMQAHWAPQNNRIRIVMTALIAPHTTRVREADLKQGSAAGSGSAAP